MAESRDAALEWLEHVQTWSRARGIPRRRREAAREERPPRREPRPHGRPRRHGKRRATLAAVWTADETPWTTLTGDQGSGAGPRAVEGCTDTAVWSHAGKPPVPRRWGRRRDPQGAGKPQAWWSTKLEQTPEPRLTWVVRRWTREVTCEAARAPVGRATQRQWHARASGRTTPVVWRLSAILTLTAQLLIPQGAHGGRRLAWPPKTRPTVAEARALVRRHVWAQIACAMSQQAIDMRKIPHTLWERFTAALCYAA